jgi:DNA-binding MarR family transcriptional regulator
MTKERSPRKTKAATADAERWAELADLVLVVAREIQYRGYTDDRVQQLTPSEGMVMRHLQRQPDAAPSQVAAATGLQRPNLSTVLRGLEKKGLIERRTHLEDRRGVVIHLTERGRTNYDVARREWAAAVSAAAGDDSSDLDAAVGLLTSIKEGLTGSRP